MQMDPTQFLTEVEARLSRLFSASKCGYRMPAQERHRLEGFMQAGVYLGLTNNRELAELMERCHQQHFGMSIKERQRVKPLDWRYDQLDYSAFEPPAYVRNARDR
ncbi:hypothetical protein [Microbulbifer sp. SAOS-129_SWC]|uniref:hypothetical protein n=1 Tax=Microbulbifer sp. SAOS-129_SWC TaxID=3145235 RepID=UPI003216FEF6